MPATRSSVTYPKAASAPRIALATAKPKSGKKQRAKTITSSTSNASAGRPFATEEFERRVAEAAYFRAEGRGFAPGGELDDWLQAECEITLSQPH